MTFTYSDSDLEKIAAALRIPIEAVAAHAHRFERAAFWYPRTEPNPLPNKPSVLRARAEKIRKAARKLLELLEVDDLRNAPDGPGAPWILELLASGEASEDSVVRATERIGRLAEIIEGINAVREIEATANKAQQGIQKLADAIGIKGHRGDLALDIWLGMVMSLYKEITGERPKFNVGASGRVDEGVAGGKFIDFLEAAGAPLGLTFTSDAWRSHARRADRSPKQD